MIEEGADVNAKDNLGKTPLHYSVEERDLDCLNFLIENGADVNAKDHLGKTPLHYSVEERDLVCLDVLIENRADVNAKDNDYNTPLDYITSEGEDEERMAKALIDAGADPVAKNRKKDFFKNMFKFKTENEGEFEGIP